MSASPDSPQAASLPPAAKQATSALAIWSLVLGILSLLTCGLTSLPGLITGILAISATGDRAKALGGRGLAIAGTVLSSVGVVVVVPIIMAASFPAYNQVVSRAKLVKSSSQARQIVLALQTYALDSADTLPPDLGTALKDVGGESLLISPLSKDGGEYVYFTPGANLSELSPDTVLFRDPGELDGKTVVAFADGSVQVVPVTEAPPAGPPPK